MTRGRFTVLCAAFFVTGGSALCLQVVWHRVLTLHAGVDLGSATTVVVAFLAGLALGNLVGGRVADRVGPLRSLLAVAAAEMGVALFAVVSVPLMHHAPTALLPDAAGPVWSFALYSMVLLVPTVLMGTTIPLAATAIQASDPIAAGSRLGWLYGINALGAAAGAVVTGWLLLGTLGAVGAAWIAAGLGAGSSLLLFTLHRATTSTAASTTLPEDAPTGTTEQSSAREAGTAWPWLVLYGLSGAVAIGLQQVFFRVVDTLLRSNAYTFSLIVGLYLGCFGLGSAVGSRLSSTVKEPRRAFLLCQLAVAVGAALPVLVLIRVSGTLSVDGGLTDWLTGPGFRAGFGDLADDSMLSLLIRFALLLPLFVLGPAVIAMGVSFPLAERIVTEDAPVGRRTGELLAVNTVGNVVGGLLTTFVLIDLLGAAGTLQLLCAVAVVGSSVALATLTSTPRRTVAGLGLVASVVVVLLPGNDQLWARLHGSDAGRLVVAEDRTCVSAMSVSPEGGALLSINGAEQNGYPFDDFHIMIGLLPTLAHPDPHEVLAVGMGVGSTSYAALADPRPRLVRTAELCGGNYEVIAELRSGRAEFEALVADPRHEELTEDGRSVLRSHRGGLDVVVVDTLLPQSASSGNTYSKEFYELVEERLSTDGVFAQWVPSARVLETAASVFPHLVTIDVPSYDSTFMLAGRSALDLEPGRMRDRFDRLAATSFGPDQRARLRDALAGLDPTCIRPTRRPSGDGWNRDLHARDEFFLNQPARPAAEAIDELGVVCGER